MRRSAIWLTIGILTGCATDRLELPDLAIPDATVEVTEPIALGPLPELTESAGLACVDRAGLVALMQYREAAEGNTAIAAANAGALEAQSRAYNDCLDAGRFMRQVAAIREEQLELARRDALVDRLYYRALLVLVAALAVL